MKLSREMVRQVMAQMGSKGGKRSLETMTKAERVARATKASRVAAKKRTELARKKTKIGKRKRA